MEAVTNKFIIGIGSQRAGSTLLHRILDRCTNIFMHPVKELHYFDTLFGVRKQQILTDFSQRQFERLEDRPAVTKPQKCAVRANRMLANRRVQNIDYLDLYRPCLLGNELVGEVTPEYMILPEEGVKLMRDTIGDDAKIILLTRDPVDRFLSSFKLLKAYSEKTPDFSNFENELLASFETMPAWIEQQRELNDYDAATELYTRYFSNFLSMKFDDFVAIDEPLIEKLESFLEVEVKQGPLQNVVSRKVNTITSAPDISEETQEQVRQLLLESP